MSFLTEFAGGKEILGKTLGGRVYKSPILLHPEQVKELAMAVLTLHHWLRSQKLFICRLDFVIHMTRKTQSFIPGSWRNENDHNCLVQLQPLQHGKNPSVVAKKIRGQFREYFSSEGVVNWQ